RFRARDRPRLRPAALRAPRRLSRLASLGLPRLLLLLLLLEAGRLALFFHLRQADENLPDNEHRDRQPDREHHVAIVIHRRLRQPALACPLRSARSSSCTRVANGAASASRRATST